jgi:hypothetical protein
VARLDWSVKNLIQRLSAEQVEHLLDSVKAGLEASLGRKVMLGKLLLLLHGQIADRKWIPDKSSDTKNWRPITDEEIAILTLWSKIERLFAEEIRDWPAISELTWAFSRRLPPDRKTKVSVVAPIPQENLEVLKELVQRACLRKLKEMEQPGGEQKEA